MTRFDRRALTMLIAGAVIFGIVQLIGIARLVAAAMGWG